jgi:hypothetical protein
MKSVLRPSGAHKSNKRAQGTVEPEDEDVDMVDIPISSPTARRQPAQPQPQPSQQQVSTIDSIGSGEDSPSRQLNGHYDPDALPELPPGPEAQEMLELVSQEAKRVGRQYQTSHLSAFLGQWNN